MEHGPHKKRRKKSKSSRRDALNRAALGTGALVSKYPLKNARALLTVDDGWVT